MRPWRLVVIAHWSGTLWRVLSSSAARKASTAYLGLVPGERSSGETRRPTSITKSGSIVARKSIVEAAWAYRLPAKVGQAMQRRQEGIAAEVRAIAWRAQLRLCAHYRQMLARRKKAPVVIMAVARELVGFIWAIGHSMEPRMMAP
jgi:hypothetical protein